MKKVALVTGASAGIGMSAAEYLLNDGLTVYVAARRVEKMQDLVEKGAIALKMDVTVEEQVVAGIEQIKKEHGGVDVLVNNAGYGSYGSMEETSLDDARYQFDVNVFGVARLTQLVVPHMREQGWGRIINVSSVGGKIYTPLGSWYHATKFALEGWSDCLRLELNDFGIEVVVVEPGLIATEFGDVMLGPMMERSGDGPYAPLAKKMEKQAKEMFKKGSGGSDPEVIGRVISKAVKAKRPKTRYVAGKMAKPILFLRRFISDRAFDTLIKNYG